MYTLGGIHFAL